MIEKVIDALVNKDCMALAGLFTDKCRYFDYCPVGTNMENYHIYGRESIEMFFLNKFTFRQISVSDPVIEDENTANYLVAYNGTYLHAKIKIEKYAKDGLIQEVTVRPA